MKVQYSEGYIYCKCVIMNRKNRFKRAKKVRKCPKIKNLQKESCLKIDTKPNVKRIVSIQLNAKL